MSVLMANAAIQGIGSLANYFIKRNAPITPKFSKSSYAKMLQERQKMGIYSPTAQQNIINQMGSRESALAANTKADYMGRMASNNLGGSIAAQRGFNEIDRNVIEDIGNAQNELTTKNELSKIDAANQYEQMNWENKLQRYQDRLRNRTGNLSNLVGELTGTAASTIGDLSSEKYEQELLNMLKNKAGVEDDTNSSNSGGGILQWLLRRLGK